MNSIVKHVRGAARGIISIILLGVQYIPSKHLKYYILKLAGVKMSRNVKFVGSFSIRNHKGLTIKDGVIIGPGVLLDARNGLTIEKCAVIAYQAIIWTWNHDYNDANFRGNGAPVSIGAYSWICSRSIILPGVSIGEGSIVASGAIVTKDVPPYSVVAGIPAKVIKKREHKEWEYGYLAKNDYSHFI
jgi:maltose O-acetyltransferase